MACEACRRYHYKCEDGESSCRRCLRVGRKCVRKQQNPFRIDRLSSLSRSGNHNWISLPRIIDFAIENGEPDNCCGSIGLTPLDVEYHPIPGCSVYGDQVWNDIEFEKNQLTGSTPHLTRDDAFLFRHFVDVVSKFFDFCDPMRHFAFVVPEKIRTCKALESAILACSARHLSRTSNFHVHVADRYYQRCLRELRVALAESLGDEALLVAVVILRFMEELDVTITGKDSLDHLLGAQAIVQAHEHLVTHSNESSLLQAAKWSALRQDLYIAATLQQPMRIKPWHIEQLRFMNEADPSDAAWANQAILHCCEVVKYFFESKPHNLEQFEELQTCNWDWRERRPESYQPYFTDPGRDDSVPDVRFVADWHVMGAMYNLLARLILIKYDPRRFSAKAMRSFLRELDESARNTILAMVGVARGNPSAPCAYLVASMGIILSGTLVSNLREQRTLHRVLVETELKHGWPTLRAQQSLEESWHWNSDHGNGSNISTNF